VIRDPALGSARGAAMTAARVAGWYDKLDAAARMSSVGVVVEPDVARKTWADERYNQLVDYWRATRRWHRNYSAQD